MERIKPGSRVDRFVVEAVLGRGGMAAVYLVRHALLGTEHALKLLHPHSAHLHQRLLLEGRTQAQLRHPNVVAVTDVVELGDAVGLVLELVRGPNLRRLLDLGRPTLDQADDLARGILAGTLTAHEAGVVHRDLKPPNILLELRPDRVVPKIGDFGVAKVLREGLESTGGTHTGETMGTPGYMAPEQVRDAANTDHRADVFALGAILYELATGERAFVGSDAFDVMTKITEGNFRPVDQVRPDLPPRMVHAIHAALVVDRTNRTQSVRDVAADWFDLPPKGVAEALARPATAYWSPDLLAELGTSTVQALSSGAQATLGASLGIDRSTTGPTMAPDLTTTPEHWGRPALVGAVLLGIVGFAALLAATWNPPEVPSAQAPDPLPPIVAGVVPEVPLPTPVAAEVQPTPEPPPPEAAPVEPLPVRSTPAERADPPKLRPTPRTEPPRAVAAPTPAPEPTPVAEPPPAAAPPVAAPSKGPAPGMAAVVQGGDVRVWLRGPKGNFPVRRGEVPAGTYDVVAFFGDEGETVRQLVVEAGSHTTIACSLAARRCTVDPTR